MKPLRHPIQELSRAKRAVLFGVTFVINGMARILILTTAGKGAHS